MTLSELLPGCLVHNQLVNPLSCVWGMKMLPTGGKCSQNMVLQGHEAWGLSAEYCAIMMVQETFREARYSLMCM